MSLRLARSVVAKWREAVVPRFLAWLGKEKLLPHHLQAGLWGERQAERFLAKAGLKILARRLRTAHREEIDLLVRDGAALVFVEVKTRASEEHGRPFVFVNRAKQRMIERAARRYMRGLARRPEYFRFDVVEVIGREDGPPPEIRHIRRAFTMKSPLLY